MAVSAEKITVYNLADLKNTSDDALPNYLASLKFTQTHTLVDVRLALGYSAVLVAAACLGWDYKFGFDATKYYTAAAVATYSILNSALMLWLWAKEKGTVYEGTAPSGEKISIATSTTKNVPIYNVTVTTTKPKSSKPAVVKLQEPFSKWFDAQGHFVTIPFQEMLATGVPVIGQLDPKRIRSKTGDMLAQSPEMLDVLLAATGGASDTASGSDTPAGKKGGKRRKV